MIDLQRRVLDPELVADELLELTPACVAVLVSPDEDVRRERGKPGGDRPDVEVVHFLDSLGVCKRLADLGRVDAFRGRFEQDLVESRRTVHALARMRAAA